MNRACPNCESEHGVIDRADANKTHGICRRHFIAQLVAGDIDVNSVVEGLAVMDETPGSYCVDLGEQSVRGETKPEGVEYRVG